MAVSGARGGLHALKGFEYQGIVALDFMLAHFAGGDGRTARPEGEDDVVLRDSQNATTRTTFVQIKKPRESDDGTLKNQAWTVSEIARELLPGAVANLADSTATQVWVLGDAAAPDARALVDAGNDARARAATPYALAIFLLAREAACVLENTPTSGRKKLASWRPSAPTDVVDGPAVNAIAAAFEREMVACGTSDDARAAFGAELISVDGALCATLARIELKAPYGIDEVVKTRVHDVLAERYKLSSDTLRYTVIPNLRAWINTVSTTPERWVDAMEFDYQLRCVWPEMAAVRSPPVLRDRDLRRPALVADVLSASRTGAGAVEVIGISGSGKTTLASSTYERASSERSETVLYAEVRGTHTLRDVLVGVAFHLRAEEGDHLFAAATRPLLSEPQAIREIAAALRYVRRPLLVLVDFVEGLCEASFARELAELVSTLDPKTCRVVTFSQESTLRLLSPMDRTALGVPASVELRGFDFEEFRELVEKTHPNAERQALWKLFEHFTAGRSTGMPANVADLLARSPTLNEMRALTEMQLGDAMREAERQRYLRIPEFLRGAVDKLVCFALPFARAEAERVFPGDRIADAIRELLTLGLLREHGAKRFEMHETVRAGLEDLTSAEARRSAHAALGAHYRTEGNVPAAVHHFDAADKPDTAKALAREAFAQGRYYVALLHYVGKHDLVTVDEICNWLQEKERHALSYLPDLLKILPSARGASGRILEVIEAHRDRFRKDFQWGWLLVECAVACDPESLADLVDVARKRPPTSDGNDLDHVISGARRRGAIVDSRLLALFDAASKKERRDLAPVLALDPKRETLQRLLRFWHDDDDDDDEESRMRRRSYFGTGSRELALSSRGQVIDFLAALPPAQPADMIVYRSAGFGRLGDLLWAMRRTLPSECRALLEEGAADDDVLIGALRVLLFFADDRIRSIVAPLQSRKSALGTFARLIPALLPDGMADAESLRSQVLDTTLSMDVRLTAFTLLSFIGVDVSPLFDELTRIDPERESAWSFALLMQCIHHPVQRAIPLLEARLANAASDKELLFLAPIVHKLGELPGSDVSEFLARVLLSDSPKVRSFACIALQHRRDPATLAAIEALLARETDPITAQMAVMAAVAARPRSSAQLAGTWSKFPHTAAWRCVIAGRLRDVSEADHLVAVATDPTRHWHHRRAAILAAARLPFEAALSRIAPVVLSERSSFSLDRHGSLPMHQTVAALLLSFAREMRQRFVAGETRFVDLFGEIFEDARQDSWSPDRSPSGREAALWLFERLSHHGWPTDKRAPDRVLDELHVPILQAAVLRGIRLAKRIDLLEQEVGGATSEWRLMRALCELGKTTAPTGSELDRLRAFVQRTPFSASPFVQNCLRNIAGSEPTETPRAPRQERTSAVAPKPSMTQLTIDEAREAIRAGQLPGDPPFVFRDLDEVSFAELARELAPARDYQTKWVPADPHLSFTAERFTVSGVRGESIERYHRVRAALRPALVAANRFGSPPAWHRELLSEPLLGKDYAHRFLQCLGATDDPTRVADEFTEAGDALLPYLGETHQLDPIRALITARLIPFLRRYARAGNDAIMEGLSWFVSLIDDPLVDPILAELFDRWRARFRPHVEALQHARNVPLWRSFGMLTRHPRFSHVRDADLRLMELLQQVSMPWYHKQDVVEVLASSSRAYLFHEMMLLKAAPFEHFHRDEVDRLDDAADKLFASPP